MKDYYKILEISPNSSLDEIKKQYRFLVNAYHPDKFQNQDQKSKAEDKVKEINEAYDVLKNDTKRREYDEKWFAYSSKMGTNGEKTKHNQNIYEPQHKNRPDTDNTDKASNDQPVNSKNTPQFDNRQKRKPEYYQIAIVGSLLIVVVLCLLIISRPTNTTKNLVLSSLPTQKSIFTATKITPTNKPSPTHTRVYTKTPTYTPVPQRIYLKSGDLRKMWKTDYLEVSLFSAYKTDMINGYSAYDSEYGKDEYSQFLVIDVAVVYHGAPDILKPTYFLLIALQENGLVDYWGRQSYYIYDREFILKPDETFKTSVAYYIKPTSTNFLLCFKDGPFFDKQLGTTKCSTGGSFYFGD